MRHVSAYPVELCLESAWRPYVWRGMLSEQAQGRSCGLVLLAVEGGKEVFILFRTYIHSRRREVSRETEGNAELGARSKKSSSSRSWPCLCVFVRRQALSKRRRAGEMECETRSLERGSRNAKSILMQRREERKGKRDMEHQERKAIPGGLAASCCTPTWQMNCHATKSTILRSVRALSASRTGSLRRLASYLAQREAARWISWGSLRPGQALASGRERMRNLKLTKASAEGNSVREHK